MKGLTEGLTVHYVLTQSDADEINRRRSNIPCGSDDWPAGAQAHVGNQPLLRRKRRTGHLALD